MDKSTKRAMIALIIVNALAIVALIVSFALIIKFLT